ncbi:transcriptional regulator [Sphingomonas piscis]|uniref:Transcriptional regulator n=1 Tax=Sphingomonas piscis TaxID=2714943 RepID=A0A6G7YS31_9SPHN|nr:transcriptional regulator [Sphingomonas piscis]QIK79547.1 transcriptional regulator [Sphingomonas piscis]
MATIRFDRFTLDQEDRRLLRDGAPVEVNGRYLDALILLAKEPGRLVSKDRFMDEVWRGVPVTDEALTQCIKTLRRQLGDDASRPRFIETVPKHGYRFIAPVSADDDAAETDLAPMVKVTPSPTVSRLLLALGGVVGGGIAGLIGGIVYGFAATAQPLQPGMGAISVLLVLTCLTILVALLGGIGVAFGIVLAGRGGSLFSVRSVVGGALGGLIVGAIVKLLGLDAFNLLLGQSPGDVTGGPEGLVLGAAVGLGGWAGQRRFGTLRGTASVAALTGGTAGLLLGLMGGRMMGGSLDLLGRTVAGSRLHFDRLGAVFGEPGFGIVSRSVTGALEGALFSGCLVAGLILASRSLRSEAG